MNCPYRIIMSRRCIGFFISPSNAKAAQLFYERKYVVTLNVVKGLNYE